jgi:hypothetical protein
MDRYRRMLVDMHIPDFDEHFLRDYDPARMAELYERANLNAVMFYCKSHVGLCNWPTRVGRMHPGLGGRDVTDELLKELRQRDIAACAYHSLIFDNQVWLEHPEWRMRPLASNREFGILGPRYGICCPNNPDYRAYEREQVTDLLTRYRFEAVFFDMTFWPAVCGCAHCQERYRNEQGDELPTTVDWTEPEWCAFQSARERWIREFAGAMTDLAKRHEGDVPVYHNFATAPSPWQLGVPFTMTEEQDFCGGDNYGDEIDQLVWCKQMLHLSRRRPPEFMTSVVGAGLGDHVSLRAEAALQLRAYACVALDSATLFIDAVDPGGRVNAGVYDLVGRVYANSARYEPYLGGDPIEDVALYASSESKVDFALNGASLADAGALWSPTPHLKALRGAAVALQRAHLPFGIITRRQLGELRRFRAVVLPNVLRVEPEEVEAFRAYVAAGGRLYASRYTSLVETQGRRHSDFLLADVFGCHLEREEGAARQVYVRPIEVLAPQLSPQRHLSFQPASGALAGGVLRLRAQGATTLATLTLPYGHPKPGRVDDGDWASIHSSPPWEETGEPAIVSSEFGRGRCIYSSADFETLEHEPAQRLFATLVRDLLGDAPSFEADVHPAVWVNAFNQPDARRVQINFVNPLAQTGPVPPFEARFALRPPAGRSFRALSSVPDGAPVPFELGEDGALRAHIDDLRDFRMLLAEYA